MEIKEEFRETFISLFEIIKNFNKDIEVRFEKEKILIKIFDCANISLLNIVISKNIFNDYKIDETKNIYINSEDLYKSLKKLKKNIKIDFKENKFIVYNDKFNFDLTLINPLEQKNIPELTYDYNIKLNSNEFFDIIENFTDIADSIKFEITEKEFNINCKNININAKAKLKHNNKINNLNLYFSSEYIDKLSTIKDIFEEITLYVGDNLPLKIIGISDNINIEYILAPKAGED